MAFVVVRIRGTVDVDKESKSTLNILGLKRANTLAVLPENDSVKGMLRKVENYITYGKMPDTEAKSFDKVMHLRPPRGGMKSVKKFYPKGDLGYRGEAIKDFVKAMMQ